MNVPTAQVLLIGSPTTGVAPVPILVARPQTVLDLLDNAAVYRAARDGLAAYGIQDPAIVAAFDDAARRALDAAAAALVADARTKGLRVSQTVSYGGQAWEVDHQSTPPTLVQVSAVDPATVMLPAAQEVTP